MIKSVLRPIQRKLNKMSFHLFPWLKKKYHERIYSDLSHCLGDKYIPFLNYGYHSDAPPLKALDLDEHDKPFRYNIQLYQFVTQTAVLDGLHILEVGSGRGGGCYYMKRYCNAGSVLGIDYAALNVAAAQKAFSVENLIFRKGDAEHLPCGDECFDVVVNVESSHCYPDRRAFFREVERVLKPGGSFLYADIGSVNVMEALETKLKSLPLELLDAVDITSNALQSMERDDARKVALIEEIAPDKKHEMQWKNDMACVNTPLWNSFMKRQWVYRSFTLKKRL